MIKYLATASLLLAGAYLTGGHALAADPGVTDTEIVIGDVDQLGRCRLPQVNVTDSACHAWDLGIVEPGWQDVLFFRYQRSRLCVAAFVFRPCLFNVLGRNEHHHVL